MVGLLVMDSISCEGWLVLSLYDEISFSHRRFISKYPIKFAKKNLIQAKASTKTTASRPVESAIAGARGQGQPLSDKTRGQMEGAFGADFGNVRVHTDERSDQLNQSLQSRAFTTGQDIFFKKGEFSPGSRGGQELLAHELTHVVQQNGRK